MSHVVPDKAGDPRSRPFRNYRSPSEVLQQHDPSGSVQPVGPKKVPKSPQRAKPGLQSNPAEILANLHGDHISEWTV